MIFHCFIFVFFLLLRDYDLIIQTTPTGTEVFDVEARDDDLIGSNSDLTFELTNTSLPFSIDEVSGEITINGSLEAVTYEIEVLVKDGGTPSLNSTGVFTLEVAPGNDAAPAFEEPFEFDIIENMTPDEAVFTFTVTDEDTGNEGRANLTLSETTYSQNFTLEFSETATSTVTGELFLLDPFDRETLTNFTLTVVATDSGYSEFRRSSSQTFTVSVGDANDNAPVFTGAPYSATVAEDRTDGHVFFQASATDSDIGTNSELEFSLLDDFDETFAINSTSGEVSVEGTLHKATQDGYVLEIFVEDAGQPSLNDTATLNVTVDEVNDNTPYFTEPSGATTLELAEDAPVGYVLLNVSAEDDDTGLAGEVEFSLDPSTSPFQIQNQSLILESSLDYEVYTIITIETSLVCVCVCLLAIAVVYTFSPQTVSEHEVFIVATDRGDPVRSTSVLVTVAVDDINEFSPEFEYSEEDFPDGVYYIETLSTARAGEFRVFMNICLPGERERERVTGA